MLNLGYPERSAGEGVYYSIRDDYAADIRDPVARRAGSSMNRVFVEYGTLIASPDTDRMVKVLEYSAGKRPALAGDVMFSSLAASLGDALSAALLTRSRAVKPEGSTRGFYPLGPPPTIFETPEAWAPSGGGKRCAPAT